MANSMDGQRDAVAHTHFTHHFRDMCFDCPLLDTKRCADLFIRPAFYQHFQYLLLTRSQAPGAKMGVKKSFGAIDEHRNHMPRCPNHPAMDRSEERRVGKEG